MVDVEDISLAPGGSDPIFRNGDTIRITNKDVPSSAGGTVEFNIINGAPTVANDTEVTITLTTGLLNNYNTDDNTYGTRVMSVYEPANVEGSYTDLVVDNASDGDFDDTGYPILLDNIGTIEQEVTLSFTSSTVFTAASDVAGVTMTGGTVTPGLDWSPDNPDVSKDYFILDYDGFLGTWADTDSLVFNTHPASFAVWQKRVIPAGSTSLAGNKAVFALNGESA